MATRKNAAAVALGRLGGKKGGAARMDSMTPAERSEFARAGGMAGGEARANKLTPKRRSEIARKAAAARWAKKAVVLLTLALSLRGVADAASKARLYDLKTGAVSALEYKNGWGRGHGPIKGTLISGEKVSGEFTTVARSDTSWGAVFSAGATATGGATRVSNDQRGSAIITGEGLILQCEYIVSALSGHGSGYCKDNRDRQYRIMF